MTLASTVDRNDYIGNDAVDTYTYSFKIFSEEDLLVTQRDDADVETTLVLDVDYTVTGVGDTAGGTIVLTAGNLPTGYLLAIRRFREFTQDTDIRDQGDFFASVHEDTFDILTMGLQRLANDLERSVRLPETGAGISTILPTPEPLKFFRWDAAGTGLEAATVADIGAVSTFGPEFGFSGGNLTITNPVLQGVAGGTVDVITAAVVPVQAALTNNLTVMVEASGANTSTTPTFNLDSLGAKTIVKNSNSPLVAGDISGANYRMLLSFDSSLDKWTLLNPYTDVSSATVQSGSLIYVATGGAADVYTADFTPTIIALAAGMQLNLRIMDANLTTTPTLNVDGLGAKTIKRLGSVALHAGDLPLFHHAIVRYNGTDFILLNPAKVEGHTHASADEGDDLGAVQVTDMTVTAAAASPPDTNTLVKGNVPKLWINFDGTGTISIRGSHNVSGIIDNGVGDYDVTVDTDFANANFAPGGMASASNYVTLTSNAVGTIQVGVRNNTGSLTDAATVSVMAMGDQ